MARPVRDYEAELDKALRVLDAWFKEQPKREWTAAEVDALGVLLPQTHETVELLDELSRQST